MKHKAKGYILPFLGDFFEHNNLSITMKKDVSLKKFLAQAHF